ncbi:exodeoxyribonuclease VII large subunit [Paracoccus aeridis]|uniref:exodeoxyribonuclease VII large subunit n=1 Tax=Paracoccus aeridis TaxID=1966466 RepID=UPI0010A9A7D4|nr:exodeoxyribonuclease VII large subunit [Paracoccus aeridis]
MDLFEESGPGAAAGNTPPLSVSEISGAVKRVIEGEFARVRVRGEVGRVSRPGSGHLYFDLKDDRACIASVCWKGSVGRLSHRPEEGMEIIATGRLTTFPGQSKYQLLVEDVEPAGLGALMAMLDQRRRQLEAEGLFHADRKRRVPYLPGVIAVVTSPSGAVIRDILHRLRDRFPSRVLIFPVAVQGRECAPQVAAAIRGLNGLAPGGRVPRPDLIIVARGGGSVEDLWGFNEEVVVRAVAEGTIPLISAVGHETDTTLIDHAADLRAPTPTAAAELAVPVRSELILRTADARTRLLRAAARSGTLSRQRLADLARGLGRPQALTEAPRQRFDLTGPRLEPALKGFVRDRKRDVAALDLPIFSLRNFTRDKRTGFARMAAQLDLAAARERAQRRRALDLVPRGNLNRPVAEARRRIAGMEPRLGAAARRIARGEAERLARLSRQLDGARARMLAEARRDVAEGRTALDRATSRLHQAAGRIVAGRADTLDRLDRLRQTLGHMETLKRGFAVIRGPEGEVVTSAAPAAAMPQLTIEFHDGQVVARPETAPPKGRGRGKAPGEGQKSLF